MLEVKIIHIKIVVFRLGCYQVGGVGKIRLRERDDLIILYSVLLFLIVLTFCCRVSLEELYNGATKHVEYKRKELCRLCKG